MQVFLTEHTGDPRGLTIAARSGLGPRRVVLTPPEASDHLCYLLLSDGGELATLVMVESWLSAGCLLVLLGTAWVLVNSQS
jgi:hypothetical protein